MIGIIIIYGFVLVLVSWGVRIAKISPIIKKNTEFKPVTFIIPFKDEARRIQPLIQSFNTSEWRRDFEVIFVDDHSSDETIDILLADLDIPFRLLKLNETSGKKAAIIHGVSNANHHQIHTLDADTSFGPSLLQNISQLSPSDLTILPVQLSGKSLLQQLNKIEFQWLQSFTFAFAKLKKPILCNGANLSFSKTAFLETLAQRSDFNLASGDDVFLLRAIKENSGKINSNSSLDLAVQTPAPDSLKDLISQRKRWIKKLINVPVILGVLGYAIYHALPFYCLLNLNDNLLWSVPLILKIIAEWILSRQFTMRQLVLIILHQFYYPIYGLVLVVFLPFKSTWK